MKIVKRLKSFSCLTMLRWLNEQVTHMSWNPNEQVTHISWNSYEIKEHTLVMGGTSVLLQGLSTLPTWDLDSAGSSWQYTVRTPTQGYKHHWELTIHKIMEFYITIIPASCKLSVLQSYNKYIRTRKWKPARTSIKQSLQPLIAALIRSRAKTLFTYWTQLLQSSWIPHTSISWNFLTARDWILHTSNCDMM